MSCNDLLSKPCGPARIGVWLVLVVGLLASGLAGVTVTTTDASAQATAGEGFVPVTPCAVFDTRFGSLFGSLVEGQVGLTAGLTGPVSTGQITEGCAQAGVVPVGASAVMVNVVAVGPVRSGNLRISPAGESATGGIVNFGPGGAGPGTNSNAVPVRLSAAGEVEVFVNATAGVAATHVRLVVLGYYDATASGQIQGTITTAGTVPSGLVRACARPDSSFNDVCVDAAVDGTYEIAVPPGQYVLYFFDAAGDYAVRIHDGHSRFPDADPVTVTTSGIVASIDADLELGGKISGVVTDELFSPVAEVSVCFNNPVGLRGCVETGSDGSYEIHNLIAGDYEVRFFPRPQTAFVSEWFDDALDFSDRESVTVTVGAVTTGVDAALLLGGTISGHVYDGISTPIEGVEVCANAIDYTFTWCVRTDASGAYMIGGVPTNDYSVSFVDLEGNYATQFYDAASIWDARSFVQVLPGSLTTDIDAWLADGAVGFAGVVTNQAGTSLANVEVCPFVDTGSGFFLVGRCDVTDTNGVYEIRGLPVDSYLLRFWDRTGQYGTEMYDDEVSFGAALPLTPAAGTILTGVNAVLELGYALSGTVTNDLGVGIEGVQVCAVSSSTSSSCSLSESSGAYSISGLDTGHTYWVEFVDLSGLYVREYFDDTNDWFSKSEFVASPGVHDTGLDASLASGAVGFEGTVLDAVSGAAIPGVLVCPEHTTLAVFGTCVRSGADGRYQILGLPPGPYRFQFSEWNGTNYGDRYAIQYFDDAFWSNAASVVAAPGDVISGVDANMHLGGAFVGVVTDPTGSPIEGIQVCESSMSPDSNFPICAFTDAAGTYRIVPVAAGGYWVNFFDLNSVYQQVSVAASAVADLDTIVDMTMEFDLELSPATAASSSVERAVALPPHGYDSARDEAVPRVPDQPQIWIESPSTVAGAIW